MRGNLYVADLNNYRVQRLMGSGRFIEEFGRGVPQSPTWVAVDGGCRLRVSDYRRVVKFAPAGGC